VSSPLTIEEALSRAKKAARQGKNDVAAQLFAAILQQDPNHPVAKKGLRKLQRQSARRSNPGSRDPSQDRMNSLIQLYSAGHFQKAEEACQDILQEFPNSVLVANVLGSHAGLRRGTQ
jgi:TolA-binding protein